MTYLVYHGKPVPERQDTRASLIIKGNQMNSGDPKAKFRIVMKAYPDTTPLAVDFDVADGDRKVHVEGIYKVEGDTLTIYWSNTGLGALRMVGVVVVRLAVPAGPTDFFFVVPPSASPTPRPLEPHPPPHEPNERHHPRSRPSSA